MPEPDDNTPTPSPAPTPTPTPAPAPTPSPTPAPAPTPAPTPTPTPSATEREWMKALPEDMRSGEVGERLSRYEDPAGLAKALIETQDWARGRVALPKEGDAQSFEEFAKKMRPESPDKYKVAVPEGSDDAFAKTFAEKAFNLGMHPQQVEGLSEWWNGHSADIVSKMESDAKAELKALELDMGPNAYARGQEAVKAMLGRIEGINDTDKALDALGRTVGARPAMELLFQLAGKTGELEKVDAEAIALRMGTMSPEAAREEYDRLSRDREFYEKAKDKSSPEAAKLKQLNAIMAGAKPA